MIEKEEAMKKKQCFLFLLLSIMVFSIANVQQVYAVEKNVDIELRDYLIDENGKEVAYQDFQTVFDNSSLNKISRIVNLGDSCYVRVKLVANNPNMKDDIIFNIDDNWKLKKDGYYYYTKILNKNEKIDIFNQIQFKEIYKNIGKDNNFSITIYADAIQGWDMIPDFNADEPWKAIQNVKTGDDSNVPLYTGIFIISGLGIYFLWKKGKMKNEKIN